MVLTQRQLFLGLYPLLSHLLDLSGEHNLGLGGTVDTAGLDGDDDTTAFLQELVGIETHDTGLVRLGNVCEDDIDHADEHPVAERVSGILNNGDDVGTVGSHANQVTAGTVRELDSVHSSSRSDDISNVTDGSTAGSTQVQNLGAGAHVDVIHTTQNTGSQLGTERVPDTVFDLGSSAIFPSRRGLNRDTLLAVNSLSGGQVPGDQQVFLTAAGNEDTGMTVRLLEMTV